MNLEIILNVKGADTKVFFFQENGCHYTKSLMRSRQSQEIC
jgi:hypothetical protein